MNERLVCFPIPTVYPGAAAALGADFAYFYTRYDMTIVYVSVAPTVDDADATVSIEDDGSAVIATISAADADVPGEWESTHVGGSSDPVVIAAGSKISFTAAGTANATSFVGYFLALLGEKTG
jgi:hypothetical protein